jgi:cell division cycle 2-like
MKISDQQNRLAEKFEILNSGVKGIVLNHLGFDLMSKMLVYDPNRRIKASEALNHPWFREEPLAIQPEQMPKFKAFNTVARENKRIKELEKLKKMHEEQAMREEEELKRQQMELLERH